MCIALGKMLFKEGRDNIKPVYSRWLYSGMELCQGFLGKNKQSWLPTIKLPSFLKEHMIGKWAFHSRIDKRVSVKMTILGLKEKSVDVLLCIT